MLQDIFFFLLADHFESSLAILMVMIVGPAGRLVHSNPVATMRAYRLVAVTFSEFFA